MALARRLAPDLLREITDGEVNWVRRFVAKGRNLCLVRGDDQGDDGGTRLLLLKLVL